MFKKLRKILCAALSCVLAVSMFAACNKEPEQLPEITVMPANFTRTPDRGPRNGVKRNWEDVTSFFCNYGVFQDAMLDYDVAIVESGRLNAEDVAKMEEAGVWKIAYITLGEDHTLLVGDGLGPGGYGSHYIYEDDMPVQNTAWGSYYVDPGSPSWQALCVARTQKLIDEGYDGIFLDTVDTVDAFPHTMNGMYNLMKLLRDTFPTIKIVLNRGFTTLATAHPFIDGIMFESFSTFYDDANAGGTFENLQLSEDSGAFYYNRLTAVKTINAVRQVHYFPVFCLDYYTAGEQTAVIKSIYDTAWEYDFIPYVSKGSAESDARSLGGPLTDINIVPTTVRGCKALIFETSAGSTTVNGDITTANLAYKENGTTITVDSIFSGYGYSCLNDGIIGTEDNFKAVGWAFINWASNEKNAPHWVQLDFASAVTPGTMKIYWAFDNDALFTSQEVKIQALINEEWVEIGSVTNASECEYSLITLTCPSAVSTVRIYQEAGKGSLSRKNLMWLTEIQVYA